MGVHDSKLQQARINLLSFALICERFQLSDHAVAAMANAVIKDLNSSNLWTKYDDSLLLIEANWGEKKWSIVKKWERITNCNFLASMAYCILGWPKRCDCLAIISGKLNSNFSIAKVGLIVHSRWCTLACRILRRYVSEQKPSTALVTLNNFYVQVYFPPWFQIKSKDKLTDGSKICLICTKEFKILLISKSKT